MARSIQVALELATVTALAKITGVAHRVASLARRLARSNDEAAQAEFEEAIADMTVELYAFHKDRGRGDPRVEPRDVGEALRDLAEAATRAGNDRKRWMLGQAFFGRFDPRFFHDGRNMILWEKACALEYPEAVCLRALVAGRHHLPHDSKQVQPDKEEWSYLHHLRDLALVAFQDRANVIHVVPTGLAPALIEYLWECGPLTDPALSSPPPE